MNARLARLLSAAALLLVGCPPPMTIPETHLGLDVLTDQYNANADKVPKLWARARVELSFTNERGQTTSFGSASPLARGNARLRLAKGDKATSFLLVGGELGTDFFSAGTDASAGLSYLWYNYEQSGKAWFGRTANAGAPLVTAIPIDPAQLMEVLGVTPLPPVTPGGMPATVMTLSTGPCAYVVKYLKPQPATGLLKLWREAYFRWDDRQPALPYHIRLYDADGLCRLLADVGDYRPIQAEGPEKSWPIMPADISVTWPEIRTKTRLVQTASRLRLRLSEMSTTNEFSPKVFDFWRYLPPGLWPRLVQVDAAYGVVSPPEQER